MESVYIYKHHGGLDIYLSREKLSDEELYCDFCEASDKLVRTCRDREELKNSLKEFADRYSIISSDKLDDEILDIMKEIGLYE